MHTHTHTHARARTRARTHTHTHTHTHTCTHTHTHTHTHTTRCPGRTWMRSGATVVALVVPRVTLLHTHTHVHRKYGKWQIVIPFLQAGPLYDLPSFLIMCCPHLLHWTLMSRTGMSSPQIGASVCPSTIAGYTFVAPHMAI